MGMACALLGAAFPTQRAVRAAIGAGILRWAIFGLPVLTTPYGHYVEKRPLL